MNASRESVSSARGSDSKLVGRLVLVVEDDFTVGAVLKSRLIKSGMRVSLAPTGVSALSLLKFIKPDAVILDLGLPDMSGLEILKTLSTSPEYFDIPVVIITGSDGQAIRSKVDSMGAAAFLPKPLDLPELLDTLQLLFSSDKDETRIDERSQGSDSRSDC